MSYTLTAAFGLALLFLAPPGGLRAARLELAAGADINAAIRTAHAGVRLGLAPGRYPGPVRLDRAVTLEGPATAVIFSNGVGSTVRLEKEGAVLSGVSVEGSGDRYDEQDAAVWVGANGCRVEGVTVHGALFGIVVEKAHRVEVRANRIVGDPADPVGMRGDSIRAWETYDSVIADNRVDDSRDLLVWYSQGNRITGNQVSRGRYGTHLMYSHNNVVADNRYTDNVVGLFLMYSRGVSVTGNVFAGSDGAAGMGLGMKESGDLLVNRNRFLKCHDGVYIDHSPYAGGDRNRFLDNQFAYCQTGLQFHGGTNANEFSGNAFEENGASVAVDSGMTATDNLWIGNYFDDYRGYDLDADGQGDIPYELRSFTDELTSKEENLVFFRMQPLLFLVEAVGRMLPLYPPRLLLSDLHPRMRPRPEAIRAH